MRQRLIYLLKHNPAIQRMYVVVMSAVFRLLGLFVPVDENTVLFSSFMGKSYSDSPKVIYEAIMSQPKYAKMNCIWAFEHPEQYPQLKTVKLDTPAYFLLALRAKYWVTNTNVERGLHFKKKSQVYLNTWHGIALKHIGNDCPGRKDYNFRTVDHLVISGEYDARVFASAFCAQDGQYLRCGMPRNEVLWHADGAKKAGMRCKLGIPEGKKVILYAPTWRESTNQGSSYDIKPPIHFDQWEKALDDQYVVLFRAHHQTTRVLGVQYNDFVRDASSYPDVNDLMVAADLLITDYSAIAFDYSILCRPILCYAYDYDTYAAERGLYFAMDEHYPHPICREEEELLQAVLTMDEKKESENTRKFRDEFVEYHEDSTKRCIDALFGEKA